MAGRSACAGAKQQIVTDLTVRTTDYIHILLPRHEVIWANGVETESFHPGTADLTSLTAEDRARLAQTLPDVAGDPQLYGAPARRNLTASEAAILLHQAA